MKSNIVRVVIWGAVLIAVAVVLTIRFSRGRLNQTIAEANASIDAGDAEQKTLGADGELLVNLSIPQKYKVKRPEGAIGANQDFLGKNATEVLDRDGLAKEVARVDEVLTKVVADYRAAAASFAAGKSSASGEVAKYLDLKSQAYECRANSEDALRKLVLLYVDKSFNLLSEVNKKQRSLSKESASQEWNFDKLETEAKKIHDDNKKLFNDG